jgi:hypothetical protein
MCDFKYILWSNFIYAEPEARNSSMLCKAELNKNSRIKLFIESKLYKNRLAPVIPFPKKDILATCENYADKDIKKKFLKT